MTERCRPKVFRHFIDPKDSEWWWYCTACDDGRARFQPRGPFSESTARDGADKHSRTAHRNRKAREHLAVWYAAVESCTDPAEFKKLIEWRFPRIKWRTDLPTEQMMLNTQNDLRMLRERRNG